MKIVLMAALALPVALANCTAQQESQTQARAQAAYSAAPAAVKSAYLAAAVASKLAVADPDSTTHVRASVNGGVITLTGKARNTTQRDLYVKTARSVSGVVAVNDRLAIDPHIQGVREQAADVALAARVSAAIAAQTGINVFHITTSVHNGAVTLRGTVSSRSVDRTVQATVRGLSGVKRLVDLIAVQS